MLAFDEPQPIYTPSYMFLHMSSASESKWNKSACEMTERERECESVTVRDKHPTKQGDVQVKGQSSSQGWRLQISLKIWLNLSFFS